MIANRPNRSRQWLVATCVFVFSALVASILIWREDQQALAEVRARATDLASDHAQTLQRDIERALSATYAIAALIRQGQGKVPDFEAVATQMLPFYPGIAALGLAPGGVIQNVVPLAGNDKSLGFDQLSDIAQNKEAIKARDTGKLTLAGPLKLAQGGMGIVGRLPVFLNDDHGGKLFWGFTYVTLRFPDALASARLPLLTERGYDYELWRMIPDTGERQIIEASGHSSLDAPVERTLELPNGQWTLGVAPIKGWREPGRVWLQGTAGFMLSLLMAYLAWLLYEMRVRDQALELQVNERTAEILAAQRQLQATLSAIPDPLFELGLDGRYYSAHSSRTQLLPLSAEDLIGKTVSQVLPLEACQVVLEALQEAQEKDSSVGKQIKLPLDNGMHWFELSVARKSALPGEDPRFLVLCRDITESKKAERQIRLLAHFDSLTGLPNRVLLTDRCNLALRTAQRNGTPLALMFLDLDHFKHVNDSLGHRVGDELLIILAGRLKGAVREQDTVSRLGGDEFIFVLPETDARGAAQVAEKLLQSALLAFEIEPHELTVTPSIGIALFPGDGSDFDTLSRCADAAMYRAKQDGRNAYRFFTSEMQARSERTLTLENALRRALERDQFRLHYQPQMSLSTGAVVGAEALLRWDHPELGRVSPAEFIPVAESCGLILPIGEWVLRTAVQQLKAWLDFGMAPITISVNLSSVQFRHADLPELVSTLLDEARLPPNLLELELTEGVAMTDPLGAIAVMNNLHERGVRMSIDDFGTGYSSLSYLKKFQIYKVKIDQSFVRDVTEDADDRAIVGAIISMASSLGMQTIAEGVETEGQLEFLKAKGCTEVQGYYFSRPLPVEEFEAFMRSKSPFTLTLLSSESDVDIRV